MKENYKKILKVWLGLYAVFTVLGIINIFDNDLLKNVFSIGVYPLQMSSLILFIFVGYRGEEKICKYGILSVIVFFIMYVLYKLSVFDLAVFTTSAYYVKDISFMDKVLTIVYRISNNVVSIFEYLAIFSLIKSYDAKIEKCKIVAMVAIIGFTLINLLNYIFPGTRVDFLSNVQSSLDYIAGFAKYAAIILCLVDNKFVSNIFKPVNEEETKTQEPIVQNTNLNIQPNPTFPSTNMNTQTNQNISVQTNINTNSIN